MAQDPLLALIKLKSLEEIIAAAKEMIHRHRRRFLQRNLRPCPLNCKGADTIGRKVVGCSNCASQNAEQCIKVSRFDPLFTKEELAEQFADQLRNPEILVREYRDIAVFLWVLGAFDKQAKTVDEHIVSKVEQREKPNSNVVAAGVGDSRPAGNQPSPRSDNPQAVGGTEGSTGDHDSRPTEAISRRTSVISRTAPAKSGKN